MASLCDDSLEPDLFSAYLASHGIRLPTYRDNKGHGYVLERASLDQFQGLPTGSPLHMLARYVGSRRMPVYFNYDLIHESRASNEYRFVNLPPPDDWKKRVKVFYRIEISPEKLVNELYHIDEDNFAAILLQQFSTMTTMKANEVNMHATDGRQFAACDRAQLGPRACIRVFIPSHWNSEYRDFMLDSVRSGWVNVARQGWALDRLLEQRPDLRDPMAAAQLHLRLVNYLASLTLLAGYIRAVEDLAKGGKPRFERSLNGVVGVFRQGFWSAMELGRMDIWGTYESTKSNVPWIMAYVFQHYLPSYRRRIDRLHRSIRLHLMDCLLANEVALSEISLLTKVIADPFFDPREWRESTRLQ